ncbi:MAG: gliding motility-associated C-terminal domain-containing protein, partial [Algoriphagus sp.]
EDGELDVTETWTYEATYTVTQGDIESGMIENTAVVTTSTQDRDQDSLTIPLCEDPSIAITKVVTSNEDVLGGQVTFEIKVANDGNVTLYDIYVQDEVTGEQWSIDELAPGAFDVHPITVVITQEMIDGKCYTNTASAEVRRYFDAQQSPGSTGPIVDQYEVIARDEAKAEACFTQNTGLTIEKSIIGDDTYELVGDQITYSYKVTNTGTVTLTGPIQITDNKIANIASIPGDLEVGASVSTTATYQVIQEDIDNLSVTNIAYATAQFGEEEVTSNEDSETAKAIVLILDEIEVLCVQDAPYIRWDLKGINLDLLDQDLGSTPVTMVWLDKNGVEIIRYENLGFQGEMLFPGAEVDAEGFATQWPGWKFENGQWIAGNFNFAAVRDGASVRFEINPEVSSEVAYPGATDACNPNPNPPLAIDDDMSGTPVVSELGFSDIVNVLDNDQLNGKTGLTTPGDVTISLVAESNPGVLTLDVNTGLVSVAPGTPSGIYTLEYRICTNPNPTNCDTAIVTVLVVTPSIRVEKDGVFVDANNDGFAQVGETVRYTFNVINTGDIALANVTIEDDRVAVQGGAISLGIGESNNSNFTATYVLTQADIDKGLVSNIATARGEGPGGYPVEDQSSDPTPVGPGVTDPNCEGDCTITVIPQRVGLTIDKVADKQTVSEEGEEIAYTLTVTNTGNLILTNIGVVDPLTGFETVIDQLLPGASESFETMYSVTVADLIATQIVNVATVRAADPRANGEQITDEDEEIVVVECIDDTLITGVIFNAETTQPLSGVPVTLVPQGDTPGDILIVVTGADGRYTFKDFVPGEYLVQVQDANLNAARGLYPVNSSLFFTSLKACNFQVKDFGYESYDGIVLGDFVWYDLNQDGIQNEWYDANGDNQVTQNVIGSEPISVREWEWFDFNGDGRYDGPENEGELNKAGFGNAQSANITVTGPNNYSSEVIVGVLGYWRDRIDNVSQVGDYTASFNDDAFIREQASQMRATGLVKVLPNAGARMTDINGVRFEEQCGLTTANTVTRAVTSTARVHLDMDFGWRCEDVGIEIIANDDDYGTHFLSFGGVLGNILENDILNGVTNPDPDLVDFEFTDLDGVVGLLIDDNGELSLIPGVNEAREYTLKYTLRETAFPDNQDDATVVFRLLNDEVNLNVSKTSFEQEIFVGDEFEYEIVLSNIGGTPATNVVLSDDLPNGVTYLSAEVTSNSSNAAIALAVTGSRLTWTIPSFEADATLTIRVRVVAETAGSITNVVVVDSEEEDTDELDNQDDDVNVIKPFHIPNVITPNNDGDNDTFEIEGISIFVSTEITILNRYGDHVLEQQNYKNDWNAPGQTAGTYFYVLKAVDKAGKSHEYKGWIQVIKD